MARPTVARINTAHLRHNAQRVKTLAPRSRVLACVKADGYGHGIITVAEALKDLADGFAVAILEEALQLRDAGFRQRIVLLEGPRSPAEVREARSRDLTLCVNELYQLEWIEAAGDDAKIDCWLKFDTGMHRLGLPGDALSDACQRLLARSGMTSRPVLCTHFANADDPDSSTCMAQLERFDRRAAALPLPHSCANSAAIIRYPDSHRDWVRPGYMLYGGCPLSDSDPCRENLLPVMELRSEVISVRDVAEGEGVGYGGRWQARRASRIATIAIGYGDGYPRHAPDGTPVWIAGTRVPLAGKVSMDMITVDITDHPHITVGSPAVLWGEDPGVDEIAALAQTIGYELLAAMPARVPRLVQ